MRMASSLLMPLPPAAVAARGVSSSPLDEAEAFSKRGGRPPPPKPPPPPPPPPKSFPPPEVLEEAPSPVRMAISPPERVIFPMASMPSSPADKVILPPEIRSVPLPSSLSLEVFKPSVPEERVICPPVTVSESLPRMPSSPEVTKILPDLIFRSSLL